MITTNVCRKWRYISFFLGCLSESLSYLCSLDGIFCYYLLTCLLSVITEALQL